VPEPRKTFGADDARRIGEEIGIDWATAPFDVEQFRIGMNVELEHGLHDLSTNVSDDDPHVTAKIALAHLNEFPDYYTRLERLEEEAKRDWAARRAGGQSG
jgi:predicted DNA-binding protein